ncbi:MAG: hypothetical protein HWN80_05835 [Candidatus Lokiarchaeota archaeon]|nr:hypothetical protein [Candidatus Lokiarchaeota archaeon]
MVNLTVNGGMRADVNVGKKVKFSAVIEAPPDTGFIVGVEWDFEGNGDYPITEQLKDTKSNRVKVKTTYTFSESGTYFPAVLVTSQRQGDSQTPNARIRNIGRVRVVVSGGGKQEPEAKQLIVELNEIPADFEKIINKCFDAIGQHITKIQGREIKTLEVGQRTERSTRFEVTPFAGEAFYTLSFEDTESGIGVFVEIDITVSGSYKMLAKTIKKATSKRIIENAIETLNKILNENK